MKSKLSAKRNLVGATLRLTLSPLCDGPRHGRASVSSSVSPSSIITHTGEIIGFPLSIHENSVHFIRMKNITLSAEEGLIEQARLVARARHQTLNAAFRE